MRASRPEKEKEDELNMLPVRIAWKQAMLVTVLVVAGAWQLSIVAQRTLLPWTKATWRTRELNGMGRSARFYLGRAGAEYLNFLRSVVPEDAPIVIPPGAVQFSEQNVLQFYLMPRAAVGCPCESQETLPKACVRCLLAPSHYVPAIGEFPPDSIMDGVKVFVPFESKYAFYRGVYAPLLPEPGPAQVSWAFSVFPAGPLLLDLLALALLLGVGGMLAIVLLEERSRAWALPAAFPLGAGIVTWTVFLLGWAGLKLSATTYLAGALIPLALAAGYGVKTGRLQAALSAVRSWRVPTRGFRLRVSGAGLAIVLCGGVLLAAGGVSIGRGYSQFDDIANWALKGYGIAEERSILGGNVWGGHTLEYPQNVPLQIAFFRLVEGDLFPASKLTFTLSFASLLLGAYLFWRDSGVGKLIASLGVLFLATVPILVEHATLGYPNLPMMTYQVLGCLFCLIGIRRRQTGQVLVGSLLLGLSAWTRLESAVYSLAVIGLLALWVLLAREERRILLFLMLPMLTIELPWLVFYGLYGASGSASLEAVARLGQASGAGVALLRENAASLLEDLRLQATDLHYWGAALPVSLFLLLVGLPTAMKRRDQKVLPLFFLFGLVTFVFLSIGDVGADLAGWHTDNLPRHLFPVVVLAAIAAVLAAGRWAVSSSSASWRALSTE